MDIKTSEVILKIAAEIEAVLNEHPFAIANPSIPKRIGFLATRLLAVSIITQPERPAKFPSLLKFFTAIESIKNTLAALRLCGLK